MNHEDRILDILTSSSAEQSWTLDKPSKKSQIIKKKLYVKKIFTHFLILKILTKFMTKRTFFKEIIHAPSHLSVHVVYGCPLKELNIFIDAFLIVLTFSHFTFFRGGISNVCQKFTPSNPVSFNEEPGHSLDGNYFPSPEEERSSSTAQSTGN